VIANTVARITNNVFVITYLSVWVAYMSDLLISRIYQGATLRNTGLSPITVRNIEACRTLGRPIYTGYFPLNKESSLENQQQSFPSQVFLSSIFTVQGPRSQIRRIYKK
jgi:hypothetical protein